jgi:hypothetical protein
MTEVIAIILSFLAGLGVLAKFWTGFNNVLKAIKELLDVGLAVSEVVQRIDAADDDKVWTNEEVIGIKDALIRVSDEFNEAKQYFGALNFLKLFKFKR